MKEFSPLGQWQGFYRYGAVYGDIIGGQETEFRLFIEEYKDGAFSGRIIDWEGLGADGQVSEATGVLEKDYISFTKQYASYFSFDEEGNAVTHDSEPGHAVHYEGRLDAATKTFSGSWEIRVTIASDEEMEIEEIANGTWRMQFGA